MPTLAVVGLLSLLSSAAAAQPWVESWAAAPAPPQPSTPEAIKAGLAAPIFNDQTIVQIVRLSVGGSSVRIRISNEYGPVSLKIGAASLSLTGPDGVNLPGSERTVLFAGRTTVTIPPGTPWLSDPVELTAGPLAMVRVALYLPGQGVVCTCHMTGLANVAVSPTGDFTRRSFVPRAQPKPSFRAFLSAIDVESAAGVPAIVVLGDSITDGFKSTIDANRRWPDHLAARLVERFGEHAPAVVNKAISGNRLLSDGYVEAFGQSGLARLDRDVLAVPNAKFLLLLEGINDIGIGAAPPSAIELIEGYRQVIQRAHEHGLRVVLSTLLPYEGARYYRPEGEAIRQAVNTWIRTGVGFDGVVDLDAVMRDPASPSRIRAELQSGDWLHPNDAGYQAMGDAVPLDSFH